MNGAIIASIPEAAVPESRGSSVCTTEISFFKEKHTMSATATSPFQRESETNKPPRKESASHSQISEAAMQEDIAKLAYVLWQQRGCPYGSPEFDWFEAEHKLRESSEHVSR
jgi:hypothetical protein